MFLRKHPDLQQRTSRATRHRRSFNIGVKLRLERLEDRTVPSGATHFQVRTPQFLLAGAPAPVEITALDAANQVVFDYRGTVHLSTSDPAAHLPDDFTFTRDDHGEHALPIV